MTNGLDESITSLVVSESIEPAADEDHAIVGIINNIQNNVSVYFIMRTFIYISTFSKMYLFYANIVLNRIFKTMYFKLIIRI